MIGALIALFLVMVVGHLARRVLLPDPNIWSAGEKISYYLLVPALLIETLAKAKLSSVPVGSIATALLTANLTMASLLLLMRRPLEAKFASTAPLSPPSSRARCAGTPSWLSPWQAISTVTRA